MTEDQDLETPRSEHSHPGQRWEDQNTDGRQQGHTDVVRNRLVDMIRSRENWYRDVWLFVITLVVLVTVVTAGYSFDRARDASISSKQASEDAKKIAIDNRNFIVQINNDAAARRDESCRYFEQQEELAIRQVRRTYAFLDRLPVADRRSNLTHEIVRGLPDQYRQAQADKAPVYCDAPNVGLPEPGSKLPRQRDFSYLLR